MEGSKRNEVWDIARGLGILFVVAGHGFGGAISRFVNLFHIPLFFFVSGLVFKFKDTSFKSFVSFLLKCIKTLWLPSFLYGVFYVLMHNPFVAVKLYASGTYSIKQTVVSIAKHIAFLKTEQLESAMWFFTAIFIGRLMLYFILWLSNSAFSGKWRIAAESGMVVCVFAAGVIMYYKGWSIPGNMDSACSLLPFMYLGYKLKKCDLSKRWLVVPSFAILLTVLIFSGGKTLRMSRNLLVDPLFYIIVSILGICFTLQLAEWLKQCKPVTKMMSYIGRNTIPILCLHLLAFRVVSLVWIKCNELSITMLSKHPIIDSSYFWGFFYTLIGLFLPLALPMINNQIKKLWRK